MAIQVLTDRIVAQIAAGEVVERPASVVKELVENALDSNAQAIRVEVNSGGRHLIRVSDDGCGIQKSDADLVFTRHATSKLQSDADLLAIGTLGFRGEALASIAAVSRMTVVTRTADEKVGTRLRLEEGASIVRSSVGAPQGTVITVENLFYNVPARMKFLKSETTERRHISRFVSRYALAYPGVGFQLRFDNRLVFQSGPSRELREVVASVYGVEIARQMIEFNTQDEGSIQVSGFASPPSLSRSNRREITIFVNGRWVQDVRLSVAVTQAYHTLLKRGRYPIVFLRVSLSTQDVDVNVHPAKTEVRFRDSDAVFRVVGRSIRRTLLDQSPATQMDTRLWSSGDGATVVDSSRSSWIGLDRVELENRASPASDSVSDARELQKTMPDMGVPIFRIVGQVGAAYIVAEGPDGLYLIDQHAAHERVLYEAFSEQAASAHITSQALLEPSVVEVSPESAALLNNHLDTLQAIGFSVEPFGGSSFLVRALPTLLANSDPAQALMVLVDDFEEDETALDSEVDSRIIARVCKRGAIKSGQTLSHSEQVALVHRLEACKVPRTCPHGRPTMIHISVEQLERQFGRK